MILQRLEDRVALDEGFSSSPYQDDFDIWTIGLGSTMLYGKPVTGNTMPISMVQAVDAMRARLFIAIKDAQSLFEMDSKQDVRWEVLSNMSYNLGRTRLSKFVKLIAAVEAKKWHQAAMEIEDSRYFRQVGNRGIRMRNAMDYGHWNAII